MQVFCTIYLDVLCFRIVIIFFFSTYSSINVGVVSDTEILKSLPCACSLKTYKLIYLIEHSVFCSEKNVTFKHYLYTQIIQITWSRRHIVMKPSVSWEDLHMCMHPIRDVAPNAFTSKWLPNFKELEGRGGRSWGRICT